MSAARIGELLASPSSTSPEWAVGTTATSAMPQTCISGLLTAVFATLDNPSPCSEYNFMSSIVVRMCYFIFGNC